MSIHRDTRQRLLDLQPAAFEELAGDVLRTNSPYESLISTGLNERGRAIPAPVDGVCWIPETSPPRGVLFAYTATEAKRLREKWLFDGTENPGRGRRTPEGDVVKALRRAKEIRREIPEAILTLILACTVDPPEELVTTVKTRCLEASVEVDFWTASRIAHFLDHHPRGHWLRKEFLGLPARLVSWELLRDLSEQSCRFYAASTFQEAGGERIERDVDRALREEVQESGRGLRFLVADSGFGKSSTALTLLRGHLAVGACGLWLTPEDVAATTSVEGAVEVALRRLEPQLEPGCGREALKTASEHQGLLLVVEDLNRSAAATALLLRLASWARPSQSADSARREDSSRWFLLCPIWPRFLLQLPEVSRDPIQELCLYGGRFTPEEGTAVLLARSRACGDVLTEIEARRLSDALGNDPLLLSLLDLNKLPSAQSGARPATLEVIDRFLELHRSRLADGPPRLAASDYKDALVDLADRMLIDRELAPTWRQIRVWFQSSPNVPNALLQICSDRQVAQLLPERGEDALVFRHDRVRDAILAAALARGIKRCDLPQAILDEPFYAELLGQALLMPGVDPIWATRLRDSNPLALFRCLQLFSLPKDPLQEAVVTEAKTWLVEEVTTARALDTVTWEVAGILAETDSPLVAELARNFSQTLHSILEARFRNGDVAAAVAYCARLELGLPYRGFTPLVEHVRKRFGGSFTAALATVLRQSQPPEDCLGGALLLAGHLGEQVLAPAVRSAWQEAADLRMALFAEFLWAALRCLPESEEEAGEILVPLFDRWQALPDKSTDTSRPPENTAVIMPLQEALFRRGLREPGISALVRSAFGRLEWPIMMLLNHVDAPAAVEFTVRKAASRGYWNFASAWEHADFTGRRLGAASMERLKELWSAPAEGAEVRVKAFRFWSIGMEGNSVESLTALRDIRPFEPFYREALRLRIRLGDRTADTELIRMTQTDEYPHYWWQHADRIWNEALRDALDSFLGHLPEDGRAADWEWEGHHFCAAEVLVKIPMAEAEALLLRHWEHLKYRRQFVQAALAVATPRCCELVAAVVKDCPDARRLMEHYDHHCGLHGGGKAQPFGQRQLEAILPYLDLFSEHTIQSLWWHCNKQRWFVFRRGHLDALLTAEQRRRFRLGQKAQFEELDRYLGEKWTPWRIDHEIDFAQERGESWDEFFETLLTWLRERRTLRALDVVAHALIWAGGRADLRRLLEIEIDGDPAEARRILDRTAFQIFRRRLR